MRMHMLEAGALRMRKSIYLPAEKTDMIDLPVSCVLLRHEKGNVLFDTGCHPSVSEKPEQHWGGLAKMMTPLMPPGVNVLSSLKAVGLGPDDVDVVVCSHLHPDHCGCNQFFRKAQFFIHSREMQAAKAEGAANAGYLAQDWDHGLPTTEIDDEHDLFGDGRAVIVPLPGHTPGTMGLRVELDQSGSFLLASDAVSLLENLEQNSVPKNTWNSELYLKSFNQIRDMRQRGTTVVCGHDDAQWRSLRKGVDAYE
ncbi:MAG TPA: MBL fold metallo-hydrolase [Afipia sp.]|nr:MBL fold metallo-hydrolase [Afipia sp.]OUX62615.1 MAG: MBL fold metallo-hydrolase [Afipia sp. TMED4]HAO40034.1 MBL fold metallo-hydrolase [Afipia sp.]HAP11875.1 MBL fold metallo-hydrolase [Afipia sp.]HAP48384.1 MBL fold metallo-hydrolase [Afipia sp.]